MSEREFDTLESAESEIARLRKAWANFATAVGIPDDQLGFGHSRVLATAKECKDSDERLKKIRAIFGGDDPRELLRACADGEWDNIELCEGCSAPATKHDVEGVPLCQACWDAEPLVYEEPS